MSGQLDNFWACGDLVCGQFHNPFFRASPTDPTLAGLTPPWCAQKHPQWALWGPNDPKRGPNGWQNRGPRPSKIEFPLKAANIELDPLFTIYSPHLPSPKSSLSTPLGHQKYIRKWWRSSCATNDFSKSPFWTTIRVCEAAHAPEWALWPPNCIPKSTQNYLKINILCQAIKRPPN